MRNKSRRLNEEPNCLIGHIIPSGRVSGANSGQAGAGPRASGRNRCEFVPIYPSDPFPDYPKSLLLDAP